MEENEEDFMFEKGEGRIYTILSGSKSTTKFPGCSSKPLEILEKSIDEMVINEKCYVLIGSFGDSLVVDEKFLSCTGCNDTKTRVPLSCLYFDAYGTS
eukprot:15332110-Ditylum_brightwellii.AAC.1